MAKRLFIVLFFVSAFMVFPSTMFADDNQEKSEKVICNQWGINFWGLSYHLDRNIDYNETNWGIGMRCYAKPKWILLGNDEDNRVFLQIDTLINSYKGLLFPVTAGAEYKITSLSNGCKLFAVGAFTFAYYDNPVKKKNEVRFGPIPGFAFGCGNLKSNVMLVPSPARNPFSDSTIVASMTILF